METVRIGVFDSGVGGLTVLHTCMRVFPHATYYYFGDNTFAPYGSRPPQEILSRVRGALARFDACGVRAAVLACNTATAVCAEAVRREFAFPIVGMEPAVRPAAREGGNVLVLCTPRTAESERMKRLAAGADCNITIYPAEGLAGAIENYLVHRTKFALADYLPQGEFTGVVLGCTHYVFFRREISAFYQAPVYDGNEGTAKRLKSLLEAGTVESKWSESTNMNKSSPIRWRSNGGTEVVFLGFCAKINRKICKRMFRIANFAQK